MSNAFRQPRLPLIVFTDLDGTLLDHDTYSFQAALPALRKLESLDVPVIPVTSKTLAEMEKIMREIGLQGPCIVENGGLIAFPVDYFPDLQHLPLSGPYRVDNLAADYAEILAALNRLREAQGYRFAGFSDLSAAQVSALTGLSENDAGRARQRLCSEPLIWQDTETAFTRFNADLDKLNYRCLRGGRFWHVMGATDKALAIERLTGYYARNGVIGLTSVALGDSPNDRQMLESADIAVVIRRKDGNHLSLSHSGRTFITAWVPTI